MDIVSLLDFEHSRSSVLEEEWPCTELFSTNEEATSHFIEELQRNGITKPKTLGERKKISNAVFASVFCAFWTPSWFEHNNCSCEESAVLVKFHSLFNDSGCSKRKCKLRKVFEGVWHYCREAIY